MARMYTFDNKLLCGSPELRIGDKVYSIDDRKNTVKKAMKLFKKNSDDEMETSDEILKLAFGKQYKEIEAMDMSFAAYQELVLMTIAAMTGEDPEKLHKEEAESFPKEQ